MSERFAAVFGLKLLVLRDFQIKFSGYVVLYMFFDSKSKFDAQLYLIKRWCAYEQVRPFPFPQSPVDVC